MLMLEVSNEYQNNRWLAYDRQFRQLAASQPGWKWSNTNSTLWSLAFTGQAKASRCKHCFSLFHQSSDCEFAPAYSSSHAQSSARRRFICRQWNEQPAQRCTFPNCRYEHVCYNCASDSSVKDIHHKAIFCPNTPAQQPAPLQRPRALFNNTDFGWCNTKHAIRQLLILNWVVTCTDQLFLYCVFAILYTVCN